MKTWSYFFNCVFSEIENWALFFLTLAKFCEMGQDNRKRSGREGKSRLYKRARRKS